MIILFKYYVDVENCESFKNFGYIYIYVCVCSSLSYLCNCSSIQQDNRLKLKTHKDGDW